MTETRTRTQRSAGKSSIRSFNGFVWRQGLFRVSQKKHFQNAVGATVHWHSEVASTPCVWKLIFRSFLTKTKPSQVMFMVKFSPTALNFCYDFVLLVHFWDTLYMVQRQSQWKRTVEDCSERVLPIPSCYFLHDDIRRQVLFQIMINPPPPPKPPTPHKVFFPLKIK